MASPTATMRFNSEQTSDRWHLVRKTALLLLLTLALALGLVILLRYRNDFPLVLFNLLADLSLGLIAGLGTRIVLSRRHGLIRLIAATALCVIGLFVLGSLTLGQSGIGPLQLGFPRGNWLTQYHVPSQLSLGFKNDQALWLDLAHLLIASMTAWIAMRAWKRPATRRIEPSSFSGQVRTSGQARAASAVARPLISIPKIHLPGRASFSTPQIKRKKPGSLISKPVFPSAMPYAGSRRWQPRRHKPDIQLAIHEEHRCPYCLEEVRQGDPRGMVECEVCHTQHHKDCWDITGACQVPHLNT
jgi:hypothetical protein